MNLALIYRQRSESQPGVPAIIDHRQGRDRILTYSNLNRLVDSLCLLLVKSGIVPGHRVLISLDPGQEMFSHLLALIQVGAVPILIEQTIIQRRFVPWIKALQPDAAIIEPGWRLTSHFKPVLKAVPRKILARPPRSDRRSLHQERFDHVEDLPPDAPALVSVGVDKSECVVVNTWSQLQLRETVQVLLARLNLKAGETDLCWSPLQLLANLAGGLTSLVIETSFAPRRVLRQMEKFKPNRVAANSTTVSRLLRSKSSPLHKVFLTDAPLEQDRLDFFLEREQHANIELVFCPEIPVASLGLKEHQRIDGGSFVGNFFEGIQAQIVHPSENSDPEQNDTRSTGELLIKGPFLPTRQKLAQLAPGQRIYPVCTNNSWYKTGALGFLDEKARFWLTKRY